MQKNYFLGILLLISSEFKASDSSKHSPEVHIDSSRNTYESITSNLLSSNDTRSSSKPSPLSISNSPEQRNAEDTPINPNNTPVDPALFLIYSEQKSVTFTEPIQEIRKTTRTTHRSSNNTVKIRHETDPMDSPLPKLAISAVYSVQTERIARYSHTTPNGLDVAKVSVFQPVNK